MWVVVPVSEELGLAVVRGGGLESVNWLRGKCVLAVRVERQLGSGCVAPGVTAVARVWP